MRLTMTVEEFYSDDAHQTNFIDRMAAFLNISWDRVRIVGLRKATGRMLLEDGTTVNAGSEINFVVLPKTNVVP